MRLGPEDLSFKLLVIQCWKEFSKITMFRKQLAYTMYYMYTILQKLMARNKISWVIKKQLCFKIIMLLFGIVKYKKKPFLMYINFLCSCRSFCDSVKKLAIATKFLRFREKTCAHFQI